MRLRLNADALGRLLPTLQTFLTQVGTLTLSLLSGVVLVLLSTVVYAVARPGPLLRGYVAVFPEALRLPATRALIRSGQTVSGWLWSNVIVGALEAVLVFGALSLLGVPGALVWGALAFFAELVPRFGFYIMAIPPVLVALTVGPLTALWVVLFFVVLNEVMGDLVAPLVRADRMDLHPVSLIFAVLALGSAFGLLGALVATPVTGMVKAFYEEFLLFRRRGDVDRDQAVEDVLDGRLEDLPGPGRPGAPVASPR
jgi:putative permease